MRGKLPRDGLPLCDFQQIKQELQPGDVILVEGRTRVARTISQVTLSPWTHAALYLGQHDQLSEEALRLIRQRLAGPLPKGHLLLEAELGLGTTVRSIDVYADEHLRICRPYGIEEANISTVIEAGLSNVGKPYDVRQIFDLARFFFPYAILPRRWRSSLFEHNAGEPTRVVCSSMLASAFAAARYPIVPILRLEDGQVRVYPRNHKLITPRDFDYSPYFQIIKYPYLGFDNLAAYRQLHQSEQPPLDARKSD